MIRFLAGVVVGVIAMAWVFGKAGEQGMITVNPDYKPRP